MCFWFLGSTQRNFNTFVHMKVIRTFIAMLTAHGWKKPSPNESDQSVDLSERQKVVKEHIGFGVM